MPNIILYFCTRSLKSQLVIPLIGLVSYYLSSSFIAIRFPIFLLKRENSHSLRLALIGHRVNTCVSDVFFTILRDRPLEIAGGGWKLFGALLLLLLFFFFLSPPVCRIFFSEAEALRDFFFPHISSFVTNREKHGSNVFGAQTTRKNNKRLKKSHKESD